MKSKPAIFAILIAVAGCSKDSPTAPTPVQPPVVVTRTLTFTPASSSPSPGTLSVQLASRGHEAGKIAVAVNAHNLGGVVRVRGGLRWDRNLLEFDSWGEGDWFKQGGALVDWTFFTTQPGQFTLFLDRPSTLPGASGSGEIILLRLKPRAGVTSGTSQIQWDEPAVYPVNFSPFPLVNVYGGTVTIQ